MYIYMYIYIYIYSNYDLLLPCFLSQREDKQALVPKLRTHPTSPVAVPAQRHRRFIIQRGHEHTRTGN